MLAATFCVWYNRRAGFAPCPAPAFFADCCRLKVWAYLHFIGFSPWYQGVVPLPQASGQRCYGTYSTYSTYGEKNHLSKSAAKPYFIGLLGHLRPSGYVYKKPR
jgi:hypothetical protein